MTGASEPLPFENCYRVPGRDVLAGEYPFHPDPEPGRERLRWLLDAGVRVFVDLTEAGEAHLVPYEAALHEEARGRGIDVVYRRHAIPDLGVPARDVMSEVLLTLADAHAAGQRAYVHCWGGAGRTGVVAGCLLRELGHDSEQALADVASCFATMPKSRTAAHRWGSPQTDEQRKYVRDWPATP